MLVPQGNVPTVLPPPEHYRFRVAGRSTSQLQIAVLLGGQGIRRVQIHDIGRYHYVHVTGLLARFVFIIERKSIDFAGQKNKFFK